MEYLVHILILLSLYVLLAVSLELLVGQTGLLSLAHAAFFGVGAYSSAILSAGYGLPFPTGVAVGCVAAICLSLVIALTSAHLYEDYFVIATFGFQLILSGIYNNWVRLTGGPYGVSGIARPSLFGHQLTSTYSIAVFIITITVVVYLMIRRVCSGPFGRVLRAIREDEVFARALGKNTFAFKAKALGVSAAVAALAGSLYAHYITYIDPSSFTLSESVLILSMVIIGGVGNPAGSVIGATVLVTLPELLRLLGLPAATAAYTRQIIYGSCLVLLMMLRPKGLLGKYGLGH